MLDTHQFDLAVLDVGLAEVSGLDLLPDLRPTGGRSRSWCSRPIRPRCGARAGRGVLSKSRASIDNLVRRRPCRLMLPSGDGRQGGRMSPVRVLHVDDEPDIREVVELSLGLDPDLQVRSCGSGGEALAAAADGRRT